MAVDSRLPVSGNCVTTSHATSCMPTPLVGPEVQDLGRERHVALRGETGRSRAAGRPDAQVQGPVDHLVAVVVEVPDRTSGTIPATRGHAIVVDEHDVGRLGERATSAATRSAAAWTSSTTSSSPTGVPRCSLK